MNNKFISRFFGILMKNKNKTEISKIDLKTSVSDKEDLSVEDLIISEDRWVRRLTAGEVHYENQQSKFNQGIACYKLGLCSRDSLKENFVYKALSLLYRKVPHLRFCIRERNGELWFAYRPTDTIDFKVVEFGDIDAEVEKEIRTPLKSSRDLWRAKFITILKSTPHLLGDEELVVKKYSQQSYLLLTFHHSTTDGFTSIQVCNLFLRLLNDILGGREIYNAEQLGEFSDGIQTTNLLQKRRLKLDSDLNRKESTITDIRKISHFRPLITKAFAPPLNERLDTTLHLSRQLTKRQTAKLFSFFKEENLTINNGFLALVNLSLVAMLQKRGLKEQSYEIASYNTINMRRYWSGDTSKSLGCHIGSICLLTDTPSNSHQNFLEYAHDIQTNINDYLENQRAFDELLYLNILEGTDYNNFDEFFANPPEHAQFFHSTSNMGNLSNILSGEGKYVQISKFDRCISLHRYNSTFNNYLQTFRGKFYFSIDYNARNITSDVAKEYINTIRSLMMDIIKQM